MTTETVTLSGENNEILSSLNDLLAGYPGIKVFDTDSNYGIKIEINRCHCDDGSDKYSLMFKSGEVKSNLYFKISEDTMKYFVLFRRLELKLDLNNSIYIRF